MVNGITSYPNPSGFGYDFNYELWTPGTSITMCNVPWDSTYRDIIQWGVHNDQALLDEYITNQSGPVVTVNNMTFAKPGHPVRIDLPFNAAWRYNYLRVSNPLQPVDGDRVMTYYYFITDCKYIAPNTTELVVQLDVWNTFSRTINFGHAYVERGHIGIANQKGFDNYGRDYLTVPEGMDLGSEYVIDAVWSHLIASTLFDNVPDIQVMVATNVSFKGNWGTIDNPNLTTATGSLWEKLPNSCEIYVFDQAEFQKFLILVSDYPWVSQGIISVTAVPAIFDLTYRTTNIPDGVTMWKLKDVTMAQLNEGAVRRLDYTVMKNWRDRWELKLPYRYRNLKKFFTSPYMVVEMTTYTGTPLILKPEGIATNDLRAIGMLHIVPPNPRLMFYPYAYNRGGTSDVMVGNQLWSDQAEELDMLTGFSNLPQFSVVNNSYLAYMASNAHSIAYSYQSADWSQQRAMAGNQLGYNQASASMDLANQLTGMGIGAMNASTGLANQSAVMRGGVAAGMGLVGGILSGRPDQLGGAVVGALGTVANTAITVNQQTQQNAINTNLAGSQNSARVGNMAYMRDTNKDYADWAAQGDYANSIAGINAKVQDCRMLQPTTSGQVGGDAWLLSVYGWGVQYKVKRINPAVMAMIGDYWLRYGYAVNRWTDLSPGLCVMDKFMYYKLRECYLTTYHCPEQYKQTIRGIFEKGVTLWMRPEYIGNLDLSDNEPLDGVVL